MRSNLEQITWQLLSLVLTQNAKKFRTNYLAAVATGIDTKAKQFRTTYLQLLPPVLTKKCEAI
jgi:hypothetical protein